jgi:hypothetical protein
LWWRACLLGTLGPQEWDGKPSGFSTPAQTTGLGLEAKQDGVMDILPGKRGCEINDLLCDQPAIVGNTSLWPIAAPRPGTLIRATKPSMACDLISERRTIQHPRTPGAFSTASCSRAFDIEYNRTGTSSVGSEMKLGCTHRSSRAVSHCSARLQMIYETWGCALPAPPDGPCFSARVQQVSYARFLARLLRQNASQQSPSRP